MSENDSNTPVVTTEPTATLTGCCKWFNNKAGYGFVTVVLPKDSEHVGSDIFAHHSGIKVDDEQYRYLVQGEYLTFDLVKTDDSKHEWQATNIGGIGGGKLMCETRNLMRQSRSDEEGNNSDRRNGRSRGGQRVRLRGDGAREGEIWTLVKESKGNNRKNTRKSQNSDN